MTDFLADKRKEISDRLTELKPQVDEYRRLEAAAEALAGIPGAATTTARPANGRRRPGRPPGSKTTKRPATVAASATKPATRKLSSARRGRRKGSGGRAAQAMSFISEQPGITIPELAVKMGIKQNYLYRVLPGLEQEGKAKKRGRGWHPGAAAVA